MIDRAEGMARCNVLVSECDRSCTSSEKFLGRQFDLGLAWVHFPEGFGGLAARPELQAVIDERW